MRQVEKHIHMYSALDMRLFSHENDAVEIFPILLLLLVTKYEFRRKQTMEEVRGRNLFSFLFGVERFSNIHHAQTRRFKIIIKQKITNIVRFFSDIGTRCRLKYFGEITV